MTHTRIIGMNSEEIMVSNDFNGEAWHILDQLLAHKKTLYMNPVNQTVILMNVRSLLSLQKYYGKFVKEFGEGVNRMCNELEQVGLKDPVYHTNAFMLQAVIYNSKVGKLLLKNPLIH